MDIRSHYKGAVIAVGGPPHSGKSVFLAELFHQLLLRAHTQVFLQRACPDGEGMWAGECDPDVAARLRVKGKFSEEFIAHTLTSIESLGRFFPLVLLDLGGKLMDPNEAILRRSTHRIIVSADASKTELWQTFVPEAGDKLLAVFASTRILGADGRLATDSLSTLDTRLVPVKGMLVNLERAGPCLPYQQAVSQFAEWLTQRFITP